MIGSLIFGLAAWAMASDAPLPWMLGKWCTGGGLLDEGRVCEAWEALPDGSMRGTSKTWHERFTTLDERMTIRRDGDALVFHAEPHGQPPADFRATPGEGMSASFENRAHDYPQRIRYWREGEDLLAEISMADGSKPMRWVYHRMIR